MNIRKLLHRNKIFKLLSHDLYHTSDTCQIFLSNFILRRLFRNRLHSIDMASEYNQLILNKFLAFLDSISYGFGVIDFSFVKFDSPVIMNLMARWRYPNLVYLCIFCYRSNILSRLCIYLLKENNLYKNQEKYMF